jgi:HK97 gp10 family phage protein
VPDVAWHGDAARDHVRERLAKGLWRAAQAVERRARELLAVSGTAQATGLGRRRKGSRIYGAARSAPGEPPRKQTGRLRASVTSEVDEGALEARVGTNINDPPYPRWLELGTGKMAPRPWLRRALAEVQGQIMQILSGGGPSS